MKYTAGQFQNKSLANSTTHTLTHTELVYTLISTTASSLWQVDADTYAHKSALTRHVNK